MRGIIARRAWIFGREEGEGMAGFREKMSMKVREGERPRLWAREVRIVGLFSESWGVSG